MCQHTRDGSDIRRGGGKLEAGRAGARPPAILNGGPISVIDFERVPGNNRGMFFQR